MCCAIVADSSTSKSRLSRISLLQFCQTIGISSGYIVGDYMFRKFGYLAVFSVSTGSHLLAILYSLLRFPTQESSPSSPDQDKEPSSVMSTLRTSFSSLASAELKLALPLLLVAMANFQLSKKTVSSALYMFTRRLFSWDESRYSVYSMLLVMSGSAGSLLVLPLLSLRLAVDDWLLGVLATVSWLNYLLVTGLSSSPATLYLAAGLGCLGYTTSVVVRSVLSKLAGRGSTGAVFSLLAGVEALLPLVVSPLIAWLYSATVHVYPGATFVAVAAVLALNVPIFAVLYFVRK